MLFNNSLTVYQRTTLICEFWFFAVEMGQQPNRSMTA